MGKGWEQLCQMDLMGEGGVGEDGPNYKYVCSKLESEFLLYCKSSI